MRGRDAVEILRNLCTGHAVPFGLRLVRPYTGELWPCSAELRDDLLEVYPQWDEPGDDDDANWLEGNLIELTKLPRLRFDEERAVFTVDGKDFLQVTGLRAVTPDGSPPNTDWKLLTNEHVRYGQVFKSYHANDLGRVRPLEPDAPRRDREPELWHPFVEPAPDETPQQVINRRRAAPTTKPTAKNARLGAARKRGSLPKGK